MELDKKLFFKINKFSCEFRCIKENDISIEYINGLNKDDRNIQNVQKVTTKLSQKKYIKKIILSKNNIICGLFINGTLVGPAGIQFGKPFFDFVQTPYEHVTSIGIFIFSEEFRRMGLGKTLVWAATFLSYHSFKEVNFGAGMLKNNTPSFKSFLSCGFRNVF